MSKKSSKHLGFIFSISIELNLSIARLLAHFKDDSKKNCFLRFQQLLFINKINSIIRYFQPILAPSTPEKEFFKQLCNSATRSAECQ
jgi:hypothetical protein